MPFPDKHTASSVSWERSTVDPTHNKKHKGCKKSRKPAELCLCQASGDDPDPTFTPPPQKSLRTLAMPGIVSVKAQPSPSPSSAAAARSKFSPCKPPPESPSAFDPSLDNPDLGPFLLKLARDAVAASSSSEAPAKALEYSLRASQSFERALNANPGVEARLNYAMSLHVVAAVYCSLGRFDEAVPVLERAVEAVREDGGEATGEGLELARFTGYMQMGDTWAMLGKVEKSIECYEEGLRVQIRALGETDPRVGETCRYLAEAQVQAMQFEKAEKLCKRTLEIHRVHSEPASLEEAADRRLMALVCEAKGDYETALEHLVLASMAMIANGQDNEVAAIDVSIGNIYLSLCRFDEATFSYQKALTVFKSAKGDNHPSVASVYVRLADLYHKTGKLRESKSYCENALRIYSKPVPGTSAEDIACGLAEISAIYESADEHDEALKLLQRSIKLIEDKPGQQSTVAGIEARMGVMFYMIKRYQESRASFEGAVTKLRAIGERKSAFFGVVLNQMGLACVQLLKIDEAAELFEEARGILEQECGPCQQDTIGVYSNLAATYDAMGRVDDSIEILEYILKLREEKLGIANQDFEDEKGRLAELLKEAGRARNRKAKSLENLIDPNSKRSKKDSAKGWAGLSLRM
ncbi:hypothetical protein MLD38_039235 [Melastoma candidum]|uniref:Uncharacterized protein n=1 Tax=Melastoma candidum TaxID=119954 RepID=A0ACB9L1S2_9MYRT|nr:hypothetical protein MLD38_039235 [Melastoma candidum]